MMIWVVPIYLGTVAFWFGFIVGNKSSNWVDYFLAIIWPIPFSFVFIITIHERRMEKQGKTKWT